jgi:hypothetical protein
MNLRSSQNLPSPFHTQVFASLGWKLALSIIGLGLAFLIAWLPWESLGAPLAVLLAAATIALGLIALDSNAEERRFTMRLFGVALGVHVLALSIFWIAAGGRLTYWLDDARAYDIVGWAIAQAWHSGLAEPTGLGSLAWVAKDTYPQLVGAFYFILGHAPAALLIFQAVLGAGCVYLTYRIAAQLLGSVTARLAGWLVIGYTGFLLYSVNELKDSLALLLILLCIYSWYRIQQQVDRPSRWQEKIPAFLCWAIIGFVSLAGIQSLREYIAQIIMGAWGLGVCHLLVRYSRRWWWLTVLALSLLAIAILVWQFPAILAKTLPPVAVAPGSTLLSVAQVPLTDTVKVLLHWIRTRTLSFSWFMLTASVSTLIAPFAWIFPGSIPGAPHWSVYFISYPGMWLWYACIPFAAYGVVSALRRTRGDILPVLFFAGVMFLVFSLLIPRETRHRDMIMPFALIFAAEGFMYARRWARAGLLFWIPLIGFMAWKMDMLLPAIILMTLVLLVVFAAFIRRQRNARRLALTKTQ